MCPPPPPLCACRPIRMCPMAYPQVSGRRHYASVSKYAMCVVSDMRCAWCLKFDVCGVVHTDIHPGAHTHIARLCPHPDLHVLSLSLPPPSPHTPPHSAPLASLYMHAHATCLGIMARSNDVGRSAQPPAPAASPRALALTPARSHRSRRLASAGLWGRRCERWRARRGRMCGRRSKRRRCASGVARACG